MSSRQSVTAPDAPDAVGPYVHAVKVSGTLLFASGQIPLDPATGEIVGDTPAAQARQCLTNLAAVAAAAGTSLASAVKLTVYMTDLAAFTEVNEVYAASFEGAEPPARVAVGVSALPRGAQVEIDGIFAVEDSTAS
jgi:2-iminobutanoate/2-iminopropanoate deaminase